MRGKDRISELKAALRQCPTSWCAGCLPPGIPFHLLVYGSLTGTKFKEHLWKCGLKQLPRSVQCVPSDEQK